MKKFTRNGHWTDQDRGCLYRVENEYEAYRYENGEWVRDTWADQHVLPELGWSGEWDWITKKEAIKLAKKLDKR